MCSNELKGWIAIHRGKKVEVHRSEASGIYQAKQIAIAELGLTKKQESQMSINPAY